ncbi:MAG: Crp/Fnr family transcriptional regulator [Oscillospiraceae bacterium]|nr:Crp/Fnr family transcriptional regulator [Oscillospiraceae bacterium]
MFDKMDPYTEVLSATPLFLGIMPADITAMLTCLRARQKHCKRGEALLLSGDRPEHVGVILSGRLHIVKDDVDGNRSLLATLGNADLFAEALCCAGVAESPVTVLADTDTTVLLLQFSRILHTCPNTCAFHQTLISNMLRVVAQKNLYLQNRTELLGAKSVQAKVLGYLNAYARQRGLRFSVPHNREEMASYLCVERSALSHTLMRMKREGIIDYRKDQFTLL